MASESTNGTSARAGVRTAAAAFAADVLCVLLFVSVGRRNHSEAVTVTGVAQTAGPFLIGLVVAWLLSRGWRRPAAVAPTGLTVWVGTVAIGMAVRAGLGGGVAASFILVATLVTGALLLGWRTVAQLVAARLVAARSAAHR